MIGHSGFLTASLLITWPFTACRGTLTCSRHPIRLPATVHLFLLSCRHYSTPLRRYSSIRFRSAFFREPACAVPKSLVYSRRWAGRFLSRRKPTPSFSCLPLGLSLSFGSSFGALSAGRTRRQNGGH